MSVFPTGRICLDKKLLLATQLHIWGLSMSWISADEEYPRALTFADAGTIFRGLCASRAGDFVSSEEMDLSSRSS